MTKSLRLSFALSAAALIAAAGGCGDRDSTAAKAVKSQAREMYALSGDGASPAPKAYESQKLQAINSELASGTSGGTDSDKAAGALMVAQSNLTLADRAMGEIPWNTTAGDLPGRTQQGTVDTLFNLVGEVDAHLGAWRKYQAIREAAGSYDPAPQLAEIAKTKAEKDQAIAAEQQRKGQLEATLNDLQGKAKSKMDAVAGRETQYAQLMEQAAKLSATEGVPLVEQANGVKREADLLRMAGTKFEAQAGVVIPQVKESQAIITQLQNQKKDLEATEAALAQHLADMRKEASEAGARAEEAGVKITEAMARLTKTYDDTTAGFSKAEGLYNKAIQAAREASKEPAGKAMQADAQLSMAYLHWKQSHAARVYGALLTSLGGVQPPLRDSATYAGKATEVLASAKASADSAAEFLEQAKGSYEGTRVQGVAKERIEALTKMLESAASVSKDLGANVSPELAALAGMNAPPATMSAAPSGGDGAPGAGGDPKATLAAFAAAMKANDNAAMMALVDMPPAMRDAMQPLEAASKKLDAAFKAKYGTTMAEAAGGAMGGMGGMGGQMNPMAAMEGLKNMDPSAATVQVNGDKATADVGGTTLNLKNVNGKWLIYVPQLDAMAGQMGMLAPMFKQMATAMDSLAAEVEAGKYPDAQSAMQAMMQKMMSGMRPPGG